MQSQPDQRFADAASVLVALQTFALSEGFSPSHAAVAQTVKKYAALVEEGRVAPTQIRVETAVAPSLNTQTVTVLREERSETVTNGALTPRRSRFKYGAVVLAGLGAIGVAFVSRNAKTPPGHDSPVVAPIASSLPAKVVPAASSQEAAASGPTVVSGPVAPLAKQPKKAKEKPGQLLVTVEGSWAYIFVDGVAKGETPLDAFELSPGVHRVKLTNPEMKQTIEQNVTIREGQTKRLKLRF
jgi:hypothetical protein